MKNERVTVLDGGMGRELMRIGAPFRQPEWSALALTEGPDWVVEAHRNFIDAGAEVITTNSYALVPFHIGDRFELEGGSLAALCGTLARRAVDESRRPVRVAGSLPPLFGSYRPDLFDADQAAAIIDPLIAGLAPSVDLWLGETLGSLAEARAVREALDRAGSSKELWLSFTLDDAANGTLRSGESVEDTTACAAELGATALLFNCSQAESVTAALRIARATNATLPLGGYANRFLSAHSDTGEANEHLSKFRDDLDPDDYASFVSEWIQHGASIVGGCCGITPDHIALLSQRFA